MPLPENGAGSSWQPTDGALFQVPPDPAVWAYYQGRRFWVRTGEVAAAIWGEGWPGVIAYVAGDWLSLDRGRDIWTLADWEAIIAGDWAAPPPSPESPDWEPAPDDPEEENWAFYGESLLDAISHEVGVLSAAIGRGIPRLINTLESYKLQLRRTRRDFGAGNWPK